MKAVAVIVLLLVCVVLFVVGVLSPARSRRMQGSVDKLSKKGQSKSGDRAGRLGDATATALKKSRKAADASARAGRRVHDKITPD